MFLLVKVIQQQDRMALRKLTVKDTSGIPSDGNTQEDDDDKVKTCQKSSLIRGESTFGDCAALKVNYGNVY